MGQEYTIKQVSSQEPKRYEGKFGVTLYHNVRFEGSDEIVSIGRKEGNAPKAGEKVYGTVTENEYGKSFKSEKNPNNSYGGSKYTRDDNAIRAQWAIGQAIALFAQSPSDKVDLEVLEANATRLYVMVDRVKTSNVSESPTLKEQWNKTLGAKTEVKSSDTPPVDAYDDITEDTEINMDDIPF